MTASTRFISPLATPEEDYGEKSALRLLASEEVRVARGRARELMAAHPIARSPDARARIDYALDLWMAQLAIQIVGGDLHTPRVLWNATITRYRWFGHEFPGSAAGIDCPDNIYRTLALNGDSEYELVGRVDANRPAQFSFHLTPHPGVDGFWTTDNLQDVAGFTMLTDDLLRIDADGTFRLTFGPQDDGRPNHIHMPPGKKIVLIRDTLSDWKQVPNALSVRRTGGAPLPQQPLGEREAIAQMAAGLERNIAFWLRFIGNFHVDSQPNALVPPYGRSGVLGYASATRFSLDDDDALIVTVQADAMNYAGMQLTDLWGIAPSPIEYLASYNKTQAAANPDGTRTYVIARRDPGIANWVDTCGWREGWLFFRWQGMPEATGSDGFIVAQQLVKAADIAASLPFALGAVDAAQRREELNARSAQWRLRIAGAD